MNFNASYCNEWNTKHTHAHTDPHWHNSCHQKCVFADLEAVMQENAFNSNWVRQSFFYSTFMTRVKIDLVIIAQCSDWSESMGLRLQLCVNFRRFQFCSKETKHETWNMPIWYQHFRIFSFIAGSHRTASLFLSLLMLAFAIA